MHQEMISCVMVTRPSAERLPRFRRTLADFGLQTYSPREMVVVIDAIDQIITAPLLAAIAESGQQNVRPVIAGRAMSLGALRNLSWAEARGEVICTWDDDDRHHPTRLAIQAAAMQAAARPVCYLQEFLHYFESQRRIY